MDPGLEKEIARLRHSKVKELQNRYRELFGEDSPSSNREHLYRRIAWRLQARETGELSERAQQRAAELADDTELRRRAPASSRREADSSRSSWMNARRNAIHSKVPQSFNFSLDAPRFKAAHILAASFKSLGAGHFQGAPMVNRCASNWELILNYFRAQNDFPGVVDVAVLETRVVPLTLFMTLETQKITRQ